MDVKKVNLKEAAYFITFWKRQPHGDSKHNSFVGGYGREGWIDIMQRTQGRDTAL